jgi:hypothetical protein
MALGPNELATEWNWRPFQWVKQPGPEVSQNKIKRFILSESNNIYNHQHPSMATCFGPFLDHPRANI